jgi:hypothetical protein
LNFAFDSSDSPTCRRSSRDARWQWPWSASDASGCSSASVGRQILRQGRTTTSSLLVSAACLMFGVATALVCELTIMQCSPESAHDRPRDPRQLLVRAPSLTHGAPQRMAHSLKPHLGGLCWPRREPKDGQRTPAKVTHCTAPRRVVLCVRGVNLVGLCRYAPSLHALTRQQTDTPRRAAPRCVQVCRVLARQRRWPHCAGKMLQRQLQQMGLRSR